jgi:ribosome-binding protein aMBF1 (putative translation factor)
MKRFEDLESKVMAEPTRRERVERERAKVVAEQVRDALGELRRVRQLTQVELSRTMQRPQSTVSRIEREGDMLLSTLAAYVEALGGHLEINALVDGHRIALTAPSETSTRRRSA